MIVAAGSTTPPGVTTVANSGRSTESLNPVQASATCPVSAIAHEMSPSIHACGSATRIGFDHCPPGARRVIRRRQARRKSFVRSRRQATAWPAGETSKSLSSASETESSLQSSACGPCGRPSTTSTARISKASPR